MRMRAPRSQVVAILAVLATGCGGGGGPDADSAAVIIIDGSSTVFRISKAAQEAYSGVNPDVTVVVDNHGTGGGFSRYLQGEVDLVDASRLAKPDEEAKAKGQGMDWTRFVVGYDGITLVVHRNNDFVKSLTVAQLKAIWEPNSKVQTWKDVDPSWPARKIVLYSPDRDSGTFEFFTEAIMGKSKSQREDVQASSDDNTLVNGVAGDPDGLGYFGYAYYESNSQKLRALAIGKETDAPAVLPSPATVLDKSYTPLSRPLFVYAKNAALRRPEVLGFVKYYLDNVADLATRARYVAPTAEDRADNQRALSATIPAATASATASK